MENQEKLISLRDNPTFLAPAQTLYAAAFPPAERRTPEEWGRQIMQERHFHALAFVRGEAFGGFISYWDFRDFLYVEHFAVNPELRGGGLGGAILDRFVRQAAGRPVVLEVEPPQSAMARRRIGFYECHGFSLSGRPYLQPPYAEGGESLPLMLMSTDAEQLEANFDQTCATIHRMVYHAV